MATVCSAEVSSAELELIRQLPARRGRYRAFLDSLAGFQPALSISMTEEQVILVDENDREIGTAEKLQAHREGLLHRAFSIFVFHSDGKLLLQKRARTKYHSDGLWTNTCCSHPRPGAPIETEAQRKLMQEMGFTCPLQRVFDFTYRVAVNNGLVEHELDHVFVGKFDGEPAPNPHEVDAWKWMDIDELKRDLNDHPGRYSYWLKVCLDQVLASVL